jgi:ABC-type antimicrobial peptide transport system permease subunit
MFFHASPASSRHGAALVGRNVAQRRNLTVGEQVLIGEISVKAAGVFGAPFGTAAALAVLASSGVAVSLVVGVLAGLVPAFQAARTQIVGALRDA